MTTKDHQPRCCVECQFFFFDSGYPVQSDVTPGKDAAMFCRKGIWEIRMHYDSSGDVYGKMHSALYCKFFRVARWVQPELHTDVED